MICTMRVMGKRDEQQIAEVMLELVDARDALRSADPVAALQRIEDALKELGGVERAPGLPVSRVARRLGVSEPTVRKWIDRGVLVAVTGVGEGPMLVESESLRVTERVLKELRERGQDGDWLQSLVDHLHDVDAGKSPALRSGLEELKRGELEPA